MPRPNWSNPPHPIAGFTLIEVLAVIIIAAVLAGIAAPGWLAFVNRQRIISVQNDLVANLNRLQSDAQQRRTPIQIWVDVNPTDPPARPQIRYGAVGATFGQLRIQPLGDEGIPQGTIRLRAFRGFDATGIAQNTWQPITATSGSCNNIDDDNDDNINNDNIDKSCFTLDFLGNPDRNRVPFKIEVYEANSPNGSGRKCVIMPTLLGQIKTEQGDGCDTTPSEWAGL
jgi:prepilin-type N-terminal cleavage/methylation domain-containing protein